ncbi:hypothetical protein BIV60_09560 [Bacillus sp. MUM 116]|uniref:hypothetical protein n=1 Tax=Bacillus sp. MUM 116 TaxID=1678002 RepID=UPI0008F5EDCB|nr:hypothetical protein [Bacillus sp. MUM 116]OIK15390.1 hypothetical protein BIV60_09560 [Bacillus sp. MUM 116]
MSKLGQAYTVLSFLKSEKIDYIFDGKQYVDFPCFNCGKKLTMDAVTTKWNCVHCREEGNIITLHRFLHSKPSNAKKYKIYNPKRELSSIIGKLERTAAKYHDDGLLALADRIEDLIDYYKKCPSP